MRVKVALIYLYFLQNYGENQKLLSKKLLHAP
jgi:hypothetical protein